MGLYTEWRGKDVVESTEGQAMLIKPGLVEILPSCSTEAVIGPRSPNKRLITYAGGGTYTIAIPKADSCLPGLSFIYTAKI